jgi:hypothetical protein
VELKKAQLATLEIAVDVANKLFLSNRAEYIEVLFTQRDLFEARTGLVETKQQQLSAFVNAYQALGGGVVLSTSDQYLDGLVCPPEFQPGEAAPFPIPPAPDQETDPEASPSQDETSPEEKSNSKEPSSQAETLNPAATVDELKGPAEVHHVDGDRNPEKLLALPVVPQPPTPLPKDYDLFESVPASEFQWQETTPVSGPPGEESSTN